MSSTAPRAVVAPAPKSRPSWAALVPRGPVTWGEWTYAASMLVIHGWALVENHVRPDSIPRLGKWFDAVFGVPSPTSGTTRAILALDRGDVVDALLFNPVAALVAVHGALFLLYLPLTFLRGRVLDPSERLRRIVTWSALGALFATWIAKILWAPPYYW